MVRIGKDDVLGKIDAPVDWWCSPTRRRALGVPGSGTQGYDLLVRFKYLLIRQWHPEDGARAHSTAVGFHAVLWPQPLCSCAR
ncbi:MAG: hypothetical protein GDA36_11195 [Rhodobacteraceae bacterium]|nr:hypothetical protein [Paracoccaceae bacterium]